MDKISDFATEWTDREREEVGMVGDQIVETIILLLCTLYNVVAARAI